MATKIIDIYARAGANFHSVAQEAQQKATEGNCLAQFEFNGVKCTVDANTNLANLFRYYWDGLSLMNWKEVGPDCLDQYPVDVQLVLETKRSESEARQAAQRTEQDAKDEAQKQAFLTKTAGIELSLIDAGGWAKGLEKNQDDYGKCIYDYAEAWGKLMQADLAAGKPFNESAEATQWELSYFGITGFMHGAAVSVLSQCWEHGEQLRKWHNKKWGHEGKGTVNPAVLTITPKPNPNRLPVDDEQPCDLTNSF